MTHLMRSEVSCARQIKEAANKRDASKNYCRLLISQMASINTVLVKFAVGFAAVLYLAGISIAAPVGPGTDSCK